MAAITYPNQQPRQYENDNCISCKIKHGQFKYGLYVCSECDKRIFIDPFSGTLNPNQVISSIDLKVDASKTEYDEILIFYRFSKGDTLFSARKGTLNFPLMVIPGILPMTQEFLDKVPEKLHLWLIFS